MGVPFMEELRGKQVHIRDGEIKRRQEANRAYLMKLDSDIFSSITGWRPADTRAGAFPRGRTEAGSRRSASFGAIFSAIGCRRRRCIIFETGDREMKAESGSHHR